MGQIDEYETLKDLGTYSLASVGYNKIRFHLVYEVNHDGHHKARLMYDGHLTDIPV